MTEIVRYTTTVEIIGDSTVPYETKQTLESSYDTSNGVHKRFPSSHTESVTWTSGEAQDTTSDGNKMSSNGVGLTTRIIQTTNTGDSTDGSGSTTTPEGSSGIDRPSSLTVVKTSKSEDIMTTTSGRNDTPLSTNCPDQGLPLNDGDRLMIDVIFNSGIDGTTYAQWLVNYASQLLAQVDNVAVHAMVDPNGQYTSAFDFINISGILGLASAAPMYSCFLSSLWDEALRNPSTYAKRDIPTQDEKTKLIVLFERRSDSNGDYNLAELLVDETSNLLAEMNSVIAGQPLDLERLDGRHLLVVALNAPIATEGLNDAILSALDSSVSAKRLSTSEYLSTSGDLPSATGSGDVPTASSSVVTFVTESNSDSTFNLSAMAYVTELSRASTFSF